MRRLALAAALAAAGLMSAAASSATAATEVGNDCTATSSTDPSEVTIFPLTRTTPSALPLTVPAPGIVTSWKVKVNPFTGTDPERLKVMRPTADPNKFEVVAESSLRPVVSGTNTFATRIPVQAGDRFGVFAPQLPFALFCVTGAGDSIGSIAGDAPIGTSPTFTTVNNSSQPAVSAVVEADADGDGFGDDTQDRCPTVSSIHDAECPAVTLGSFAVAGRSSVLFLVTADQKSTIAVSGTVNVPKKNGGGKSGRLGKQLTLTAADQAVSPGSFATFTLEYPKALKRALAHLPKARSTTVTLVATTTNPAGVSSESNAVAKLKGRGHR